MSRLNPLAHRGRYTGWEGYKHYCNIQVYICCQKGGNKEGGGLQGKPCTRVGKKRSRMFYHYPYCCETAMLSLEFDRGLVDITLWKAYQKVHLESVYTLFITST